MTGPFDFFTTSRLGSSFGGFGVDAVAAFFAVSSAVAGTVPASTATAPIIALRIMNARRSTPSGTSTGSLSRSSDDGRFSSSFFMTRPLCSGGGRRDEAHSSHGGGAHARGERWARKKFLFRESPGQFVAPH